MSDIERLLARAGSRILINRFLTALVWTLVGGAAALGLLLAIDKLTGVDLPWTWLATGMGAASTVAALIWAFARQPKGVSLADEVDRRAGLHETLSTALVVAQSGDGWSKAVVGNAGERARRVVVRDSFPLETPRRWGLPFVLAALLAGAMFLPERDLTGLLGFSAGTEAEAEANLEKVKLEIEASEERLKELATRAGVSWEDEADEAPSEALDEKKPETVEEVQRRALRKLTSLNDKLREQREGPKGQQLDAMRRSLANLRQPGPGPMSEFARSLARSNFGEAQKKLTEAMAQLNAGQMSEAQQQEMREQLESMSQQLERLARNSEDLMRRLEQAGLSREQAEQVAGDEQALQEALEQLQTMSPEQMDQLLNQAMAQMNSEQSMESMASAMGQMAQSMPENGQQQSQQASQAAANAMNQMSGELSASEMMSQEMAAAEAAMGEAQGQMTAMGEAMAGAGGSQSGSMEGANPGEGSGQAGDFAQGSSQQEGSGSGGGGQGLGASIGEETAQFILDPDKANVETGEGPIIGSTVVYGAQVKGEAKKSFGAAVESSSVRATEAVETMRVPRELHDAVRQYFGRLQERTADDAEPAGDGS